jgi:hypothetical protein
LKHEDVKLCSAAQASEALKFASKRGDKPAAEFGGALSLIAVPMFKDGELVGAIVIYRARSWDSRRPHGA